MSNYRETTLLPLMSSGHAGVSEEDEDAEGEDPGQLEQDAAGGGGQDGPPADGRHLQEDRDRQQPGVQPGRH